MANVTVTECLSKPTSKLAAERRSQGKQGPTFAICVCFYITVSALSTDFDTFSDLILVYCFLRAVLCPALSIAAACCSLWSANNWHSKSRASASVEAPRVADELLAARCSFWSHPLTRSLTFPIGGLSLLLPREPGAASSTVCRLAGWLPRRSLMHVTDMKLAVYSSHACDYQWRIELCKYWHCGAGRYLNNSVYPY